MKRDNLFFSKIHAFTLLSAESELSWEPHPIYTLVPQHHYCSSHRYHCPNLLPPRLAHLKTTCRNMSFQRHCRESHDCLDNNLTQAISVCFWSSGGEELTVNNKSPETLKWNLWFARTITSGHLGLKNQFWLRKDQHQCNKILWEVFLQGHHTMSVRGKLYLILANEFHIV